MRSKTTFGMVAGAVALALSASAFANTSTGASGTIFLSIDDQTSQTDYVFDTGLSAQNFDGNTAVSKSFNTSNLTSFLSSVAGGNLSTTTDTVTFSVIGGGSAIVSPNTTQTRFVDFTSNNAPAGFGTNGASTTTTVASAYGQIGTFLNALANPSGGSSYIPNTNVNGQWFEGGNSANFDNDLVVSNGGTLTSSLAFYQETALLPASSSTNGVVSTYAGTWSLNLTSDTLNYNVVPLPAPLLLLLSGLGAMGIVGRRNRAAA